MKTKLFALLILAAVVVGCSSGPEPEAPPAPTSASKFESSDSGATPNKEKTAGESAADR